MDALQYQENDDLCNCGFFFVNILIFIGRFVVGCSDNVLLYMQLLETIPKSSQFQMESNIKSSSSVIHIV